VAILNSTITGNAETANLGSTVSGFQSNTTAAIVNTTFSGNTHAAGQSSIEFPGAGSVVELRASILDDPEACNPVNMTDVGFNVDVGSTCPAATGSVSNAPPLLAPLGSNGGPTQTVGLLPGSPALDRVPVLFCDDIANNPLLVDQRGATRSPPPGGACDAGAHEGIFSPPAGPGPGPVPSKPGAPLKCKKKKKKGKKRLGETAKKQKKKCKKKGKKRQRKK
jgi:hypothetical protein